MMAYDFTGTGIICTFESNGSCTNTYEGRFNGSVAVEVLTAGPNGDDSFSDLTDAYDYNGWVQSHFVIQWAGNSFSPAPLSDQTVAEYFTSVHNGVDYDGVENEEGYSTDLTNNGPLVVRETSAVMNRYSGDTSWLSDLSFPLTAALAPDSFPAQNSISFEDSFITRNEELAYLYAFSGYHGYIDLDSLTPRSASVPEPGTLPLLIAGLAGLGALRRRAALRSKP